MRSNSSDPKRISTSMNPSRSRSNAGLFEADEIDNDHPPLLMSSIDGPLSTQVSLFSFEHSLIIANKHILIIHEGKQMSLRFQLMCFR